jgi:glutathione peroxidase
MATSVHDFTVKTIRGESKKLADYKGKVLLIVNVASECGYTPQYEGLEKLYEQYKDKGFAVLGFPANDFGAQEPGSNEQIETFCTSKFGVKFPMFSKVSVKGEGMEPLFDYLQSKDTNPGFGGPIKWNFNKFLIGKNGEILGRFEHKIEPNNPDVKAAIDKAISG